MLKLLMMLQSTTFTLLMGLLSISPTWLGPAPPSEIKRIVSLAPSMTELIFALGAGHKIVGVTRYATWPDEVKNIPKIGGFIDPDLESIARLEPDLIVAVPTSGGSDRVRQISELGMSVLVLSAKTLEDLWGAIDSLGQILNQPVHAKELTNSLQKDLTHLKEKAAKHKSKRVVVALGHKPLVVAGPGSFVDSLLLASASENVIKRGGPFPHIDLEALVRAKPDLIIDISLKSDTVIKAFWQSIPLLKLNNSRQLIILTNDALLRPGPRLIQGLDELYRAIWSAP